MSLQIVYLKAYSLHEFLQYVTTIQHHFSAHFLCCANDIYPNRALICLFIVKVQVDAKKFTTIFFVYNASLYWQLLPQYTCQYVVKYDIWLIHEDHRWSTYKIIFHTWFNVIYLHIFAIRYIDKISFCYDCLSYQNCTKRQSHVVNWYQFYLKHYFYFFGT